MSVEQQLRTQNTEYKDLLAKTLQELKIIEKLADVAKKDQQAQQIITNIEFALEEMQNQMGTEAAANSGAKKADRDLFDIPLLAEKNWIEPPLFAEIKSKLQAKVDAQKTPILIEGECGMGKSMLAAHLAYDQDVRSQFSDGIFWIGMDAHSDIFQQYQRLAGFFNKSIQAFVEPENLLAYMQDLFAARCCLLILDNAEDIESVLAFMELGNQCRVLITTHNATLPTFLQYKTNQTLHYQLAPLEQPSAIELLGDNSQQPMPSTDSSLNGILETCASNPLALKLAANTLASWLETGMVSDTESAWKQLLERLQEDDWEFDEGHPYYLMQALYLYLEALGEQGECYLVLAVFADPSWMPVPIIFMLWQYMFNLPAQEAQSLLDDFAEKGLLQQHGQGKQAYVSLHSFQYAYLHDFSDVDKLHQHMLAAYLRQCGQGWLSGPDDGYFYTHVCTHLLKAGRLQEARSLLLNFDWIKKSFQYGGLHHVIHDYGLLDDADLARIQHALLMAASVLHEDPGLFASELLDRLWQNASKDIQAMLNQAKETLPTWEPPMPENNEV
ncbi:NB-ARC domain-containing protein [Candidatus Venteria ishoeyi]|uniref:NB-ARC domain-containing protein n=1 Tax=Candidatus Venteria ishoeyi TaxID=1899563 RepID=UPI0025A571B4|nr:NB-ARC domain-containing protein [Candidatus Venteria ishoeyi]MDM8544983.1 NB-ARC domain-containing protein [Candidatus Venteria ishoeyi]